MSYALRNSVILLAVLILFVAGGWGYLHYYQEIPINELEKELADSRQELKKKEQVAARYDALIQSYRQANKFYNSYGKGLYPAANEDRVFNFLTTINRGMAFNEFNFVFQDSTVYPKYGILAMEITGKGRYRNVVNFIRAIELSEPLNKVRNVNITPIKKEILVPTDDAAEPSKLIGYNYNTVSYSFDLKSYYDRRKILEERTLEVSYKAYTAVDNPFYPLIHDVQPNTTDKINVSQSELIALSSDKIFLIDQNGVMQQLQIGDEVYLGQLSKINLQSGTATFILNKGGIIKEVTIGDENE